MPHPPIGPILVRQTCASILLNLRSLLLRLALLLPAPLRNLVASISEDAKATARHRQECCAIHGAHVQPSDSDHEEGAREAATARHHAEDRIGDAFDGTLKEISDARDTSSHIADLVSTPC